MMLACILPFAACGKKPPRVDPPSGVDDDTFPMIYPPAAQNK